MRYRVVILLALAALAGGCAARSTGPASGPVPRPFPGAPVPPSGEPRVVEATPPAAPPAAAPAAPAPVVVAPMPLIATALSFRGVPYRYAGTNPETGFDCSGFVQYVFAQIGVRLPREVKDQYRVGEEIEKPADVEAGDLIFFETVTKGASHVGLAIGGDQFVHAPSSTGVVRVERFTSSYWGPKFVGARRVH